MKCRGFDHCTELKDVQRMFVHVVTGGGGVPGLVDQVGCRWEGGRVSNCLCPGWEGSVLGGDGAQEAEGLYSPDWGVCPDDGVGWGWHLPEVHYHLHWPDFHETSWTGVAWAKEEPITF